MIEFITPFTPEWEKARIGTFTSSEFDCLFTGGRSKEQLIGKGGLTYINKKIGEIMSQQLEETKETDKMTRGNALEPEARERYSMIVNEKVEDSVFIRYNAIFGGTNDGYIKRADGSIKSILEIKCPDSKKHTQVLSVISPVELKDIDSQYYHQPQGNMLFAGADYADFVSYDDRIVSHDLQIAIIRCWPDMDWRKQFKKIVDWTADYMNNKIELIMAAPERYITYRVDEKLSEIKKLQNAINSIQEQTVI